MLLLPDGWGLGEMLQFYNDYIPGYNYNYIFCNFFQFPFSYDNFIGKHRDYDSFRTEFF